MVLTDLGFQQFAEAYVPDYNEVVVRVAELLVNETSARMKIASRTDRPVEFVNFFLNLMESNGHIKVSKHLDGQSRVWQISPSLKRALQTA